MTTTGKVFKSYAEAIIAKHGFGSNKMVPDWSTDFLKRVNEDYGTCVFVPKEAIKDDPNLQKAFDLWKECYEGQRFLLNEGYIKEYSPKNKYGKCVGTHYVGLTLKGWSVAGLYINKEA